MSTGRGSIQLAPTGLHRQRVATLVAARRVRQRPTTNSGRAAGTGGICGVELRWSTPVEPEVEWYAARIGAQNPTAGEEDQSEGRLVP